MRKAIATTGALALVLGLGTTATLAVEPTGSAADTRATTSGADFDRPLYLQNDMGDSDWDDDTDDWHLKNRLGIWAPSVDGTIGAGGQEVDFEADFDDIIENVDLAFTLDVEAGKGPLTVGVTGMFMNWEADATTIGGFDADLAAEFAFVQPVVYYEVLSVPLGNGDGFAPRIRMEVFGGARWTYAEAEISINEGPFAGVSPDRDEDLLDALGGLRGRIDFTEQLNLTLAGSAGGGDSDTIWEAVALLEYRFTPHVGAFLGYKVMDWDFETNGNDWDVTLDGPMAGLSIRW